MNQNGPAGLGRGEELLELIETLAGEVGVEREALVGFLDEAHLVDFIGSEKVAAFLGGQRQRQS